MADLASLNTRQLRDLHIDRTPVNNVTPLEGARLEILVFTPKSIAKGLDVIRKMRTLHSIGVQYDRSWPPAEFWKKYDAGEFK
ncbi:MAG: hypothetical protein NTW87_04030 [Planctomycetota bacterium]|nr:hypothetical protein [Planctomycetota bacterium]